jgi:hypothetical protein
VQLAEFLGLVGDEVVSEGGRSEMGCHQLDVIFAEDFFPDCVPCLCRIRVPVGLCAVVKYCIEVHWTRRNYWTKMAATQNNVA